MSPKGPVKWKEGTSSGGEEGQSGRVLSKRASHRFCAIYHIVASFSYIPGT